MIEYFTAEQPRFRRYLTRSRLLRRKVFNHSGGVMANGQPAQPGMTWLAFSLVTVVSWGVYGILLHTGQMGMASAGDAANARYKAFLFVGIAYFLTAVLA